MGEGTRPHKIENTKRSVGKWGAVVVFAECLRPRGTQANVISTFPKPSRITLGTAQLGMRYGIANRAERPDNNTARVLLDRAWSLGIRSFDTARAYGDAEQRLGRWLAAAHHDATVISKLPKLGDAGATGDAVKRAFDETAAALGNGQPSAYLAHHIGDFASPAVAEAFAELKEAGRIAAFGASVYTPEDVEHALAVDGLSVIQLPVSLFNRRMIDSGALVACAEAGIMVFARSVFVQGLIFLDPDTLPDYLTPARKTLKAFHALCADANIAPLVLALAAALEQDGIHSVVVGADTPRQIEEVSVAAQATVEPALITQAVSLSANTADTVFDPSRWP